MGIEIIEIRTNPKNDRQTRNRFSIFKANKEYELAKVTMPATWNLKFEVYQRGIRQPSSGI